jgi:prepilin-type processing-associated H-X9-DG protein/prepilin-type N-terminal cleavage/methylation domain-containing protein
MNRRTLGRHGFTLVELLVVIGIIAVLIGVLLPALNQARQQALLIQCQSNMRQWGVGLQIYVDANGGALPLRVPDGTVTEWFGPSPNNPIPGYPLGLDDMSIFFNAIPASTTGKSYYQMLVDDHNGKNLLPAAGSNNIFTCPASQAAVPTPYDTSYPGDSNFYALYGTDSTGVLLSATTPGLFKSNISYCYNKNLMNPPAKTAADPNPPLVTDAKMSQLRPTSSVVVLVEKIATPGEYLDPSIQRWVQNNGGFGGPLAKNIKPGIGYASKIAPLKANWTNFAARHNGGGNLLFADGHVAFYKWTDTQIPVTPASIADTADYNANRPDMIWCPWGPCNN